MNKINDLRNRNHTNLDLQEVEQFIVWADQVLHSKKKYKINTVFAALIGTTKSLVNNVLHLNNTVNLMLQTVDENTDKLKKLHAMNRELTGFKTIIEAALFLEEAFARDCDDMRIRIILAPNMSADDKKMANPIAQMFADAIELIENNPNPTPEETAKLKRLTELIPVVPETLGISTTSHNIKLITQESYDSIASQTIVEDVSRLKAPIFWRDIHSALIHKLENIGAIAFLSPHEGYFTDADTTILTMHLENISDKLMVISELEENTLDPLTKLPNRRRMSQEANKAFEEILQKQTTASFVLVDLDKFKHVNDTYWHDAGDVVLKKFASVLSGNLKDAKDIKVRWGGEEFAVLMKETTPEEANKAMLRVSKAFFDLTFAIDVNGNTIVVHPKTDPEMIAQTFRVSMSAGVVGITLDSIENKDSEDALKEIAKKADSRLYAAKEAWRNRIVWYDASQEDSAIPEVI